MSCTELPCPAAQLVQALEWCLELGVPCVSVYAFSLENFNRSAEEVDLLMGLAERKLLAIVQVRSHVNTFCGHKRSLPTPTPGSTTCYAMN